MKRLIYSGVRPDKENFYVDYTYNHPKDIIDIVEPQLYIEINNNVVYHFGYRFNDNVDSKTRTRFIHAVKQIGENPLSDREVEQFISRPLSYLDQVISLYKLDCLVYPLSGRSELVPKIIRAVSRITSRKMSKCSFELVKQAPEEIEFDFDRFRAEHEAEQGYRQMLHYIETTLLPKLHQLDYFSIARDVKAKYRPYISRFIDFSDEEDLKRFSQLQGSNILIIDDINTTGSTLDEILRKLGEINSNCNMYVFTLIGSR